MGTPDCAQGMDGEGVLRARQVPEPAQEALQRFWRGRLVPPPPFSAERMPQQRLPIIREQGSRLISDGSYVGDRIKSTPATRGVELL